MIIDGISRAHWIEKSNTLPQSKPITNTNTNRSIQQNHQHSSSQLKLVHYKSTEIYLNTRSYLERGMNGKTWCP